MLWYSWQQRIMIVITSFRAVKRGSLHKIRFVKKLYFSEWFNKSYEKLRSALVYYISKFDKYLYGVKFIWETDNQALSFILARRGD